jgi:arginyl-tRNA synthetase
MNPIKDALLGWLAAGLRTLHIENVTPALDRPKQLAHGDFATNVALQCAKAAGMNPRAFAEKLIAALPKSAHVEKTEIAGPGFINIHLAPQAKFHVVGDIRTYAANFGHAPKGRGKVMVEFVSANPTGPLHVGHARQAAVGDVLCRALDAQGYAVTREFYYNDGGNQIENLAVSVQARARGIAPDSPEFPADGYKGEYIADVAADFLAKKTAKCSDGEVTASGDVNNLDDVRAFAVAYLRREQDLDLQAFGLQFDVYYLESSLYTSGRVQATVDRLIATGKTYEEDGGLFLRTTEYGDDKDRVMRKRDGGYTYFVPDVAYHLAKFERGFNRVINVQGTDHFGTIARVRAGVQAVSEAEGRGVPNGFPDYVLHSMVKVVRGGEEVKLSKRAGSYVTLRDLIDWVGRDAVRFFLVSRTADTPFTFDIDLARSQSEDNPVYYVQYAHARLCSVLGKAESTYGANAGGTFAPELLTSSHEDALARKLADFPEVISAMTRELAPHLMPFYLRDVAALFHSYYNAEQFLVDDASLRHARLQLVAAAGQVLKNGLALLGVSAPEKM